MTWQLRSRSIVENIRSPAIDGFLHARTLVGASPGFLVQDLSTLRSDND